MSRGRNVSTNKIGGYLLLSALASLKRWRRGTLRYAVQHSMLADWQARVAVASGDYEYALSLANSIEIVRGYGETWERGYTLFLRSLSAAEHVESGRATALKTLHHAALMDEGGDRFNELIAKYGAT